MLAEMLSLIGVPPRPRCRLRQCRDRRRRAEHDLHLARALFTDYMLPFEIAAVILTVAMVAAVMLTLRRRGGTKHQDPSAQSRVRKASDRVRMVKMKAETPAPPAIPRGGHAMSNVFSALWATSSPWRGAVLHQRGRHLPQPQERHHAADGDRTDAAQR
jgi:hypothetical protein